MAWLVGAFAVGIAAGWFYVALFRVAHRVRLPKNVLGAAALLVVQIGVPIVLFLVPAAIGPRGPFADRHLLFDMYLLGFAAVVIVALVRWWLKKGRVTAD
jgi:hypothetical protein